MSHHESSPWEDIKDVAMDVQPDVQRESKSESEAKDDPHPSSEKEEIEESASTTGKKEEASVENTGGEPPDPDGWHTFPLFPPDGLNMVVLHDGDAEWLGRHKENVPLGIRGPEGYIWAERPEDLLWAECSPHFVTRMSISQLRLLESDLLLEIVKGEEDLEDTEPIRVLKVDGDNNRQEVLEILCGKPTIIHSIPYHVPGFEFDFMGPARLNVHIPFNELPSTLDVFDEDDVTNPGTHDEDDSGGATFARSTINPVLPVSPGARPVKYRIVDPTRKNTMNKAEDQATHATLVVSRSRRIGAGNSARVYEGQICLEIKNPSVHEDQAPSTRFPPKLRIIAKVGTGLQDNKYMRNEAKMYHSFPEHFSREYYGFQLVKPSHFPHRLSQIVPYFYGFYEPVEDKIDGSEYTRAPIILMEDCGTPIKPSALTQYQKAEIVSMIHRMHKSGFVHHSVAPRNILVQAGSLEPHMLRETIEANPRMEFSQMVDMDMMQLQDAVQMRDIPRFV